MMSFQLLAANGNCLQKPLLTQPILPSESPNVLPCFYNELDFSDVFGPTPIELFKEFSCDKFINLEATINGDENIHSQPHSFVGSISEISHHLKHIIISLLDEEEDGAPELPEEVGRETQREFLELKTQLELKEEKSNKEFDNINLKHQGVGLEDFEILKVVGEGGFGKVYQVRRGGTYDIYVMKVI